MPTWDLEKLLSVSEYTGISSHDLMVRRDDTLGSRNTLKEQVDGIFGSTTRDPWRHHDATGEASGPGVIICKRCRCCENVHGLPFPYRGDRVHVRHSRNQPLAASVLPGYQGKLNQFSRKTIRVDHTKPKLGPNCVL
jgi:hypothetical protein